MENLRELAGRLAGLSGEVASIRRAMAVPQLPHSSLDDASVPEKDAEGNVVSRWGKQEDGTHGVVIFDGPTPPVPAGIAAEGGPVSVTVAWGGTYADDVGRLDFHLVEVYAAREPFEYIEDAALVGAIPDPDGGPVTFSRPVGEWWIGLVTLSRAGKRSAVSALVTAEAASVLDQAILDELDERLDGLGDDLRELYDETLPTLLGRLDTLRDETLPALQGRLEDAEDVLGPLPGRVEQAEADAAAAQGAADAAAGAASTAQGAAEDAAGIAEGKGETIVQVSPPSGSRARVENLWIRLPDHKVHVYDEGAAKWVAATDPDLIAAAQEAAQALADAAAAAADAAAAATAAQEAHDRAEALETQVGTLQTDLAAAEAAIATVRDTTLPALNADLATLRDTTIPDLEAIVGPLPGQVQAAATAASNAATAASNAQGTADQAISDAESKAAAAQAAAEDHADAQAEAARLAAIAAASDDAEAKANAAQAAAEATAAADALDKANAAQQAAEAVANAAQQAADDAQADADALATRADALEGTVGTLETSLGTLRDTTIPNLEAIVGPLPAAVTAAQAAADAAQNRADEAKATSDALAVTAGTVLAFDYSATPQQRAIVPDETTWRNPVAATLEWWAYYEGWPGSQTGMFWGEGPSHIEVDRASGMLRFRVANSPTSWNPGPTMPERVWTHLAVVHDMNAAGGPEARAYMDGELIGVLDMSAATTWGWGRNFQIGNSGQRPWNGRMKDVRLWMTVRTQEQIAAGMAAVPRPNAPGLVAHWNAVVDGQFVDVTGNGYNADLTGDPLPTLSSAAAEAARDAAEAKAAADAAHDRAEALEGQVGTLQTDLAAAEQAVGTLRDTTLPALNTRLESTEYDLANFSAEWITAGTLDTDRLNANAVAAAVGEFIKIHANQITAGLIQGSQIEAETVAAAVGSFLELNANQITAGLIQGDQIEAQSIYAAVANLIRINASQINAGQIGADRIAVNDLAAAVATVIELDAGRIRTGQLAANRINVTNLAVALATVLSLDAGRITSGTIDTERLDAEAIGALVGEFITLSAEQITAGEIGADRIAVNELFTALFVTNKITAAHADLGSFAADDGFVGALRAATLVVGGPWSANDIASLPASKIGSGTLNTARVPTLPASKIGSGTLADARIPNLAQSKITGLPAKLTAHDGTTTRVAGWTTPGQTTIDGGKITTNSIQADQIDVLSLAANEAFLLDLSAQNILASNLTLRGEQSGWTTEVGGQGLQTIGPDGQSAIQLGNYDELGMTLYHTVQTDDGPVQEAAVSISNSGEVGGSILHANESLTYRGDELSELLNDPSRPQGLVARTTIGSTRGPYTTHTGIAYLRFIAKSGRSYRVNLNFRARNTTGNGLMTNIKLRTGTSSYPTPDINMPTLWAHRMFPSHISPNWYGEESLIGFWVAPGSVDDNEDIYITTFVTLDTLAGDASLQWVSGDMWIEDIGAGYSSTSGYHLGGAAGTVPEPPPSTPTRYTRTYTHDWHRTWDGNGATPSAVQGAAYHGRSPHYLSAGIYRSKVGIKSMTSDLSGSTIKRVRVRVKMLHSHGSSGGTVVVGVHNNTSRPSTFATGTNTYGVVSSHFSRGQEKWVDIPSNQWSKLISGSFRGVSFYINSTNSSYYCYMDPRRTAIEVTYEK